MMFFDIHTHHIHQPDTKNNHIEILNLFPSELETVKTQNAVRFFSLGAHPRFLDNVMEEWNLFETALKDSRIVAIGEAGLDKYSEYPIEFQIEVFRKQILLSETEKMPLIIHNVRAWDIFFELLSELQPTQPWVLHGFRGKPELTKRLLSHGLFFSFGEHFNTESIKIIPLNKIFCETDEQAISIENVYQKVAQAKSIELETLSKQIHQNVNHVFGEFYK